MWFQNVYCNSCVPSKEMEDDLHLFQRCSVTACLWLPSRLGLGARDHQTCSSSEWLCAFFAYFPCQQRGKFMMCLWAIWTERNEVIWKGSTFNPLHIVQLVIALLEDYKKMHPVVT